MRSAPGSSPSCVDRGHEVIGTSQLGRQGRAAAGARRGAGRARPARRAARSARPCCDAGPEAIIHQATALAGRALLQEPRPHLRADQPAADRGHRRPAGRGARGGRAPVRRPELRPLPLRARGRPGQDRGRPARPRPAGDGAARRNAAMRHLDEAVTEAGGIALRYGGFYGAANDGLIEPVRKRQFPIVGDGGGVIVVHPPRRRRRGDRARARARRARHLQHRRRRARPGARVAAGARRGARRQAAAPRPALARAADRRRGRGA